ncbi:MAG: NAD(P)-dependent oxidoreductase [Trebonia sp.]
MKTGAILVSISRGSLVEEQAGAGEALRSGHLAGVGLDVYDVSSPTPPTALRWRRGRPTAVGRR